MTDENDFAPAAPEELPSALDVADDVPTLNSLEEILQSPHRDVLLSPESAAALRAMVARGELVMEDDEEEGEADEAPETAPAAPAPLPTHWVNAAPEGLGLVRFQKLVLDGAAVNALIEQGVQLCMEPHLPPSIVARAMMRQAAVGDDELVLLEVLEDDGELHPEHLRRIEVENENRRVQHEANQAAKNAG